MGDLIAATAVGWAIKTGFEDVVSSIKHFWTTHHCVGCCSDPSEGSELAQRSQDECDDDAGHETVSKQLEYERRIRDGDHHDIDIEFNEDNSDIPKFRMQVL
jgi:hypothetical protein